MYCSFIFSLDITVHWLLDIWTIQITKLRHVETSGTDYLVTKTQYWNKRLSKPEHSDNWFVLKLHKPAYNLIYRIPGVQWVTFFKLLSGGKDCTNQGYWVLNTSTMEAIRLFSLLNTSTISVYHNTSLFHFKSFPRHVCYLFRPALGIRQ